MADNGLARLNARFKALPRNVQQATEKAAQQGADELVARARDLAPVDDGDLKASITSTPGGQTTPPHSQPGGSRTVPDGSVFVTAGNAQVRYAHLQEYGTLKHEASPYFWPSYRLLKQRITSRITRAARKAIKERTPNVD